jgi:alkanesulfonate monooxygenase SsuD/methylene tetrahydromethanopterin reductase-like flavin-dependent oxidoreductase (luciferase family)
MLEPLAAPGDTDLRTPRLDEEPEIIKFARVESVQYEGEWAPAKYDASAAKASMDGVVAESVEAEQLGYDAILATEHHFDGWTMIPSPNIFLAAVAARTSRIRLGHAVRILPVQNPWYLAEETGMLDILSNGRAEIGVGKGNFTVERARFGLDAAEIEARYDEKLKLLTMALSQEDVTFEGRYDCIKVPSTVYPRPFGPPLMPWVSASRPESIEAAGRAGHNLLGLAGLVAPGTLDRYVAAAGSAGLHRSGANFMGLCGMIIAPTEKEAEELRAQGAADSLDTLLHGRQFPQAEAEGWVAGMFGSNMIGTPERVLDELGSLIESTGMRRLIVVQRLRSMPESVSRQTMHLFAEQVIPHLRHLPA